MTKTVNKKKYELDMTNGSIMDKLVTFALPLMLSSVLQLLFNAVDIVVVGRFSGQEALAAVGSTTSLIHMLTNLFIGVSLGANIMTARYTASRQNRQVSEVVHTAIMFSIISGVAMVFIGIFLSRPALEIMSTPDNVIDMSVLYLMIYFGGMPFFMIYNFGAAILRAVGDTRRPLYYLIVAGIANVILNLVLVVIFHLGVVGVGIGTVVSEAISTVLILRCLKSTTEAYKLEYRKLRIYKTHLLKMLKIGLPAGIQGVVISFSNALLQSSVNSFGDVAMAGYAAANNIFGFMYVCINSVTQACMSFTSQNYGASKPARMDKVFINCIILQTIIGTGLGALVFIFSHTLIGIYTVSDAVIACGVEILLYTTLPYALCGYMDMIPGALRGMGYSTLPMILSIVGTVGLRIVWIFGLFPFHRTLKFLFLSYPLSWLLTILLQGVCFYFVRKHVHRKLRVSNKA